jgi:N utilization substance protein B
MGMRRRSRELAMQALFFMDMKQDLSVEMLACYCDNFPPSKQLSAFFKELVTGVIHAKSKIDTLIERYSNNWKLSRMSCVDRNVMRIAVFELLFCKDIPAKVSINEAIDVGKRFGTDESGAFINGILDSIQIALENRDIAIEAVEPIGDAETKGGNS